MEPTNLEKAIARMIISNMRTNYCDILEHDHAFKNIIGNRDKLNYDNVWIVLVNLCCYMCDIARTDEEIYVEFLQTIKNRYPFIDMEVNDYIKRKYV